MTNCTSDLKILCCDALSLGSKRLYCEQGSLQSSYMTLVLCTARISNVNIFCYFFTKLKTYLSYSMIPILLQYRSWDDIKVSKNIDLKEDEDDNAERKVLTNVSSSITKLQHLFQFSQIQQYVPGVLKCFEVSIRLCKPCDCEKFIKGQKVIVLTTVTRKMLLIRGQKSSGHWLVLKSLYVN